MSSSPKKKSSSTQDRPPRVALVLGAGGAKGIAHIGVLKVLHEAGIPVDLVVGCSIGSLIGSFYADGHEPDHILERAFVLIPPSFNFKTFGWPSFFQGFSGQGFFNTEKIQNTLMKELRARTFEELTVPLKVIATDIHQGALKEFSKGPLIAPVCASAAIPGLFKPVKIGKRQYVDGGLMDELPTQVARSTGAQLIIASNVKGWLEIEEKGAIENLILRSYYIMRHHFDRDEEREADVTIRPDLSGVMNILFSSSDVMQEVYKRGQKAAKKKLPYIEKLLKKLQ